MNIFQVISGQLIDDEIVQIIKDKLLLKYDEEFEVYKLGRRAGTALNDSVTAYCRSLKNKDTLFVSVLNGDKVHFSDDYCLRLICFELQKELINKFKEEKITVYPRINIIGCHKYDKKTKLENFIKKEPNVNFLVDLYVKDKVLLKDVKKIIEEVKEKYKSINLRGNVILLDSNSYEEYINIFKEMSDSDNYYVESSSIIDKYRIERI